MFLKKYFTPADGRPIPHPLRVFLAAGFVSNVGSGLTLPFLLIYLHQVRHISLGVSGALIGGLALISLPIVPLVGTLVDTIGPRTICAFALFMQAVGTAVVITIHSPQSALLPLAILGIGEGATWPSINALLAVFIEDETMRPRIFALNFQLLNLGLGIGALVAGLTVHVSIPASFMTIYIADGATTLVVVLVLMLLPARIFALSRAGAKASAQSNSQTDGRADGYRQVFRDKRMVRYLITASLLAFASYGAVSAGFVGFATTVIHVGPRTIAWAFTVNTGLIVLAQPLGLTIADRIRRTTALSVVAGIFGCSWAVLGIASLWPHTFLGNGLVVLMFGIFGFGEILLSPVWAPLINDLAPDHLRGRYNACAAGVFSCAAIVSPLLAGYMLEANLGTEYLGLLVASCLLCLVGWSWLRQGLTDVEDHGVRVTFVVNDSTI